MNIHTQVADVSQLKVFSDASGAEAIVKVGRYKFAANYLGEISLNLISKGGSAWESKIAANKARKAYNDALCGKVSILWLAKNIELYKAAIEPLRSLVLDTDGNVSYAPLDFPK